MSTPSSSQKSNEEFNATIHFPAGDFRFKANKVNIEKSADAAGVECWTIIAFHEVFKDNPEKGLAGIKEVIGIHLNIPRASLSDDQPLGCALLPPALNKNSGNLFRILDKIPDEKNRIDTVENSLGESGQIAYSWNTERTRVTGTFSLLVRGPDEKTVQLAGNFNILNSGQHLI